MSGADRPSGPVLVTGGTKRLGFTIARALANAGFDLILHARTHDDDAERAAAALASMGRRVDVLTADLGDPTAVEAMAAQASRSTPALSGLVNNAALFDEDRLDELTPVRFFRHQTVNTLTPLLLAKGLRANLAKGHGAIINILDHNIENPNVDFLSYKLSKFALAGSVRILARDLAPEIRVNGVAPGLTLPSPLQTQDEFDRIHNAVPLDRGSRPDDVAAAVVYLMSAAAVTGQVLFVDGGERFLARLHDVSIDAPGKSN